MSIFNQNKSAAVVGGGLDAIDSLLAAAGLQKSAATGPDSEHQSNRADPNNMTPPVMTEFNTQRAELKNADVPSTLASSDNAYNDGTPLNGSFQGANTNEVDDKPEVPLNEVPQETDASTESPATVDVNNVEGKSAAFNQQVQQLVNTEGLHKAANLVGQYALEQLDGLLGVPAAKQAAQQTKEAGAFAAAEEFLAAVREDPEGYLAEKAAMVRDEAYEAADILFDFLCEKRAEEEEAAALLDAADEEDEAAAELEALAEAEELGGEALPQDDIAGIQAIAEGGDVGDDGEGISEEELIAALSDALDANEVSPEDLPELEAANLPPEMPPEMKEASVRYIQDWAAGVNRYRNDLRSGRAHTKRASVRSIQLTNKFASEIRAMVAPFRLGNR